MGCRAIQWCGFVMDGVSVVIVNYNRRGDLRAALESVSAQDCATVEIVVVDNASTDGSCEMVARNFPKVRVLALSENLGMAGYSLGFEQARGEIIFQMDNDSLMPDATVLKEVLDRFGRDEDLAVVATRVEEYRAQENIAVLRARDTRHGPLYTGGFHSGGVGFRRKILEKMGGYPRDVFLYGSELFLQMRFLAAGYRIGFFPEILMLHKSSDTARSKRGLYYELRNRYWFMRCFATGRQRLRYLPGMLAHDALYALAKGKPGALVLAWRDGFGSLPRGLTRTVSTEPAFVAKVEEVGERLSLRGWARERRETGSRMQRGG